MSYSRQTYNLLLTLLTDQELLNAEERLKQERARQIHEGGAVDEFVELEQIAVEWARRSTEVPF